MSHDPSQSGASLSKDEVSLFMQRVEWASERLRAAKNEISKDVWNQDHMIEMILATMVAGGNVLAQGLPGLAKTLTVKAVARATGLDFKRIQFTPDLQPIDLTGAEILDKKDNTWQFRPGPLFGQLILADEINRAGQKTQSAMLEAMEEKQITVDGTTRVLPRPYHVLATQNPVDQEGTSPLPEAQADRFMTKLIFTYPNRDADVKIMQSSSSTDADIEELFSLRDQFAASGNAEFDLTKIADPDRQSRVQQAFTAHDLIIMQKIARRLPLSDSVVSTAVNAIRMLRPTEDNNDAFIKRNVEFGPSPRALIAFALVAKAKALIDGRIEHGQLAPRKEDILNLLEPVLQHRMALKYNREQGVEFEQVFDHVRSRLQFNR